jgi:hypothetical protein
MGNTASKLGYEFKEGSGAELGNYNWSLNSKFSLTSHYAGAVMFYINSETQVSENFNNVSRQSNIAGMINQVSDKAMEAMFAMGGLQKDLSNYADIGEGINKNDVMDKGNFNTTGGGLLHTIAANIGTILAGGKMHFPEMWADSQFGRSYNVTIKLDSPDPDPLSIYLNIIVPLIHILGFVIPRNAGDNTYISPFLVRAFYKSFFHIDMGIITGCNVTKGDQGCWTQAGLPTQVTVQLDIKDLYTVLSLSKGEGRRTLMSNPAQMDYLANMCGINIAPSNFGRSLKLWMMLRGFNRPVDYVLSRVSGALTSMYATFQNFFSLDRNKM